MVKLRSRRSSCLVYHWTPKVRKKAQKLLNEGVRLALCGTKYANCEGMMEKLRWLNVDNEYQSKLILSLRRATYLTLIETQ